MNLPAVVVGIVAVEALGRVVRLITSLAGRYPFYIIVVNPVVRCCHLVIVLGLRRTSGRTGRNRGQTSSGNIGAGLVPGSLISSLMCSLLSSSPACSCPGGLVA